MSQPAIPIRPKTLAEYRADAEARAQAATAAAEARELEGYQLVEKFEGQGLRKGVDFDVLVTEVGCFSVRKPEYIVAKQFLEKDKQTLEDTMRFVEPCIMHPDVAAFRSLCLAHGGLVSRCTLVALSLYEAKRANIEGKL